MLIAIGLYFFLTSGWEKLKFSSEITPINTIEKSEFDHFVGKGIVLKSKFLNRPPYNQGVLESINNHETSAFFDFDSGKNASPEESDIYLGVGCGSGGCTNLFLVLNRTDGTMIINTNGDNEPSYQDCVKVLQKEGGQPSTNSGRPINDSYFCIKTNKSNVVKLHVISNQQVGDVAEIRFDYEIWYVNE